MIHSTASNLERYFPIHPRLAKAAQAFAALHTQPFEPGKHPVDGDDIFINAVEYETKPIESAILEAHRAYIDVMLLLEGEERIACCDLSVVEKITQPYETAKDALLAEIPVNTTFVWMRPGDVAVLFPEDCHAPGLDTDGRHKVKKLIAKVRL